MKPYQWMVEYTSQTNWIERKGLIIWLSFYAGILGSGCYLVSLYFNSLWGMFVSWLIILVLKGGLHIAHAKRPLKLWRMMLRPQTSWISRGLILTILLIVFGAIQLAFSFWLPGTIEDIVFKILTGIMAFGIIIYTGLTMNYVNAIPFWNSALLPVLFILWGILSGFALVMVIGSGIAGVDIELATAGNLVLLISAVILIALYLWTATYAGPSARQSVRELTRGYMALVLGIGVVLLGIIIPLVISLSGYFGGDIATPSLTILVFTCEVIGGAAFTYSALKAGIYNPLIPTHT